MSLCVPLESQKLDHSDLEREREGEEDLLETRKLRKTLEGQ